MRLLYGTYNPGKMAAMRRSLETLNITLVGLSELPNPPPDAEETGATPLENARIKAIAYRSATGMTTLAADSGLYIDGLSDAEQPGEHARRYQGHRMSDEEMIDHYAKLVSTLGGKAVARYRNGLCIAFADGRLMDLFDDSVASKSFYLLDKPHPRRVPGFPLDSLSADMESGRYYFDLPVDRADTDLVKEDGFCRFVSAALSIDGYAAL